MVILLGEFKLNSQLYANFMLFTIFFFRHQLIDSVTMVADEYICANVRVCDADVICQGSNDLDQIKTLKRQHLFMQIFFFSLAPFTQIILLFFFCGIDILTTDILASIDDR